MRYFNEWKAQYVGAQRSWEWVKAQHFGNEKENALQVNLVHLNEDEEAITIAPFDVSLECNKAAKKIRLLPFGKEIPFVQANGVITFRTQELRIFDMYEIELEQV